MGKIEVGIILALMAGGGVGLILSAVLRPNRYAEDRVIGIIAGIALVVLAVIQVWSKFGWAYFAN